MITLKKNMAIRLNYSTDTDSVIYEIETKDFYKEINPGVERWFDTSNIPSDHLSGIK